MTRTGIATRKWGPPGRGRRMTRTGTAAPERDDSRVRCCPVVATRSGSAAGLLTEGGGPPSPAGIVRVRIRAPGVRWVLR